MKKITVNKKPTLAQRIEQLVEQTERNQQEIDMLEKMTEKFLKTLDN